MSDDLTIRQSRRGKRRVYRFEPEKLVHTLCDESGERQFSVPYEAIDPQGAWTVLSKNPQFVRAIVRFAWAGIIFGLVIASFNSPAGTAIIVASAAAFIGVLLAQSHGVFSVRYTFLKMSPVPAGANTPTLSIISDAHHDAIMAEIERRWRERLRTHYATADLSGDPEKEAARLKWLKERDVISDAEFQEQIRRLQAVRALSQAQREGEASIN